MADSVGHRFTFDYPRGFSNIPAYSGKIYVGGNNGEALSVPYFGVASDLRADLGSGRHLSYRAAGAFELP